jgi:hypothetical protein
MTFCQNAKTGTFKMSKKDNALVDIDTPVFSYFQALYLSFYSSRLYVDVGKRWKGFGFLYTLLLVSILSIPLGVKWSIRYNDIVNLNIIQLIDNLPTLYVQNGALEFDKPMPFLVKNNKNEVLAVIDSTGQINTVNDMDSKYPNASLLVTKNNIQFKIPNPPPYFKGIKQEKSEYTFGENTNEIFNPQEWAKTTGLGTIKNLTLLLVYPMILSLFLSIIITFIPVMALLGQLFSTIFFTFKVSFKQACRIMAVASTPTQLIFFSIITLINDITNIGIFIVALLAIYFSFAVIALKRESKLMVLK